MCNSLFTTGTYIWAHDFAAAVPISNMQRLEGVLNHINYVKDASDQRETKEKRERPSVAAKLYGELLFYKNFVNLSRPLILCEGVTDNIYLKTALRKLPAFEPKLIEPKGKAKEAKISFFKYTTLADKILRLGGGAGGIKNFITHYHKAMKRYKHALLKHPVIILIDNDDGAKEIFSVINSKYKIKPSLISKELFYPICHNLYLVKTPEQGAVGTSCIEDFFDASVRGMKLGDKTFNPSKQLDPAKEFGKVPFAEKIILPNKDKINFVKLSPIFDRIVAAMDHYKPPVIAPAGVAAGGLKP